MNGRIFPFGVRYRGNRLDTGPLDEFHRALNMLRADTCERGRCGDGGQCGKHARRRRQQEHRKVEP